MTLGSGLGPSEGSDLSGKKSGGNAFLKSFLSIANVFIMFWDSKYTPNEQKQAVCPFCGPFASKKVSPVLVHKAMCVLGP